MTKRRKSPTQPSEIRRKERRDKIRAAIVAMRLEGHDAPAKFPSNLGQLYANYSIKKERSTTWQQHK